MKYVFTKLYSMFRTIVLNLGTLFLNVWYNCPQYWIHFIEGVLSAYTYRSYCLCIMLFREILAEGVGCGNNSRMTNLG